jgi:hypothetical protein
MQRAHKLELGIVSFVLLLGGLAFLTYLVVGGGSVGAFNLTPTESSAEITEDQAYTEDLARYPDQSELPDYQFQPE